MGCVSILSARYVVSSSIFISPQLLLSRVGGHAMVGPHVDGGDMHMDATLFHT